MFVCNFYLLQPICLQPIRTPADPNQLPPTVISQAALSLIYDQSLFKRLNKKTPVQLLDMQYRMHPEISRFPSKYFYADALKDAPNMLIENTRPWHEIGALGPYRFFDVPGIERSRSSHSGRAYSSLMNEVEGKTAVALIALICSSCPRLNFANRIGIITPYKEQRRKIRKELCLRFGDAAASCVEVSTVDGFQGQEREIIIFSCVRTGEGTNIAMTGFLAGGIGFLNDARRMNVALTRSKCSLYILGKSSALINNSLWRSLILDARSRNVLIPYDEAVWRPFRNFVPNNLAERGNTTTTNANSLNPCFSVDSKDGSKAAAPS